MVFCVSQSRAGERFLSFVLRVEVNTVQGLWWPLDMHPLPSVGTVIDCLLSGEAGW